MRDQNETPKPEVVATVMPTGKGYKFMNHWKVLMINKAMEAGIEVKDSDVTSYLAKVAKLEAFKKELGI